MEPLRKLSKFRAVFAYSIASVTGRVIGLLMLPVLSRYLTPEDYGIVASFQTLLAFTVPLVACGISGAIARYYYKLDETRYSDFVRSVLSIPLATFVIASLVTLTVAVFGPPELFGIPSPLLLLLPIAAVLSALEKAGLSLLRVQERPWPFVGIVITNTVVAASVSFLLVAMITCGSAGRIFGIVSGFAVAASISAWLLQTISARSQFNRTHVSAALKFGAPLILHQIGAVTIAVSDRIFLVEYTSLEQLGIYYVAQSICSPMAVLIGAYANDYQPKLYKTLTTMNQSEVIAIIGGARMFLLTLSACALAMSLLANPIFGFVLDRRYATGATLVPYIVTGHVVFAIYKLVSGVLFFAEKTITLARLSAINFAVSVLANFLLIPTLGAEGAAIATIVSFTVMASITFRQAQNSIYLPWLQFIK